MHPDHSAGNRKCINTFVVDQHHFKTPLAQLAGNSQTINKILGIVLDQWVTENRSLPAKLHQPRSSHQIFLGK